VIIPTPYRLLALALTAAAALAAAWAHGHHTAAAAADVEMTALRGQYAQTALTESEARRAEEHRTTAMAQEVSHVAQLARDHAATDERIAVDSHNSLLDTARTASRSDPTTCDPTPADSSPARPTAADLCVDVLGWIDSAAGTLAAALDRSFAAGAACERFADEVIPPTQTEEPQ